MPLTIEDQRAVDGRQPSVSVTSKMTELEQAICNALFLLETFSTALCQELQHSGAAWGGDSASGAEDVASQAKGRLHRAFHDFHREWRTERLPHVVSTATYAAA